MRRGGGGGARARRSEERRGAWARVEWCCVVWCGGWWCAIPSACPCLVCQDRSFVSLSLLGTNSRYLVAAGALRYFTGTNNRNRKGKVPRPRAHPSVETGTSACMLCCRQSVPEMYPERKVPRTDRLRELRESRPATTAAAAQQRSSHNSSGAGQSGHYFCGMGRESFKHQRAILNAWKQNDPLGRQNQCDCLERRCRIGLMKTARGRCTQEPGESGRTDGSDDGRMK